MVIDIRQSKFDIKWFLWCGWAYTEGRETWMTEGILSLFAVTTYLFGKIIDDLPLYVGLRTPIAFNIHVKWNLINAIDWQMTTLFVI